MFIQHGSAYYFFLWHCTMHRKCFFSQPFIFHFLSGLLPHLNLNLELIPTYRMKVISAGLQEGSPLTLLVIGQHTDDCPLCENNCISNAKQVIIAVEIQRCWT